MFASTLRSRLIACLCSTALLASLAVPSTVGPAHALSEIQKTEEPPATDGGVSDKQPLPPATGVPQPDPIQIPAAPNTGDGADGKLAPMEPGEDAQGGNLAAPANGDKEPPAEISYDLAALPEPVRRMHDLIIAVCKEGDIEKLRPLIGTGESATQLSYGGIDVDPVEFLRSLSGDEDGHEILAIIEEVLSAGYAHVEPGTPNELYVWPYFFAVPLEKLTARQRVELFKIVTGGDYEEMKAYGGYTFYRIGITPAGQWSFFVAGD